MIPCMVNCKIAICGELKSYYLGVCVLEMFNVTLLFLHDV